MKKTFLSTLVLIGASLSSFAQLDSGEYAPDFTVTPLNAGQVPFHLYAELNAGRAVILDVSATWCNPCWNYHNTGKLEQLHDAYGPSGTNELRVLWIDGDPGTTDQGMMGNGTGTMGNWLNPTGSSPIPFPMANPVQSVIDPIVAGYQIQYFPTLYLICPNRTITEVEQSNSIAELYAMVNACPVAAQPVDVVAIKYEGDNASCAGLPARVRIQNMGTTPLTSVSIVAQKDGNAIDTLIWTGNLNTYDTALVDMGELPFSGAGVLKLEVTANNDANVNNGIVQSNIVGSQEVQDDKFVVEVKLDDWADDTYFKLSKSDGTIILEKQYASLTDNSQTYSYPIDLDVNECYYMKTTDAYGDGLVGGYIKILKLDGTTAIFVADTHYTQKEYTFTCKAETHVSIEEAAAGGLFNVYPNPATEELNTSLTLNSAEMVTFRIVNAQGQTVMAKNVSMNAGTSVQSFDISTLAAGIYTLQISTNEQVSAKAFIKK